MKTPNCVARELAITAYIVLLGIPSAASALVIVASTPDIGDLARLVANDDDEIINLLTTGTQDPHFLDAQPGLIVELNRADLLVYTGLELEVGWLPALLRASANPDIQAGQPGHLNASSAVEDILEVSRGATSREFGDVHPLGNPHYMLSPYNARRVARMIAGALIEIDPGSADEYTNNLREFLIELDERVVVWEEQMAPYEGARVITYHRTWSYLADWLDLNVVDELEPLPGIPPNPAHLATLVLTYSPDPVDVIILEPWSNITTSQEVALQIGTEAVVLPVQPGGVSDGDTYLTMMDALVERLAEALGN